MKDKELEKILKGFPKMRAPSELDRMMMPYMRKRKSHNKALVFAFSVVFTVFLFFVVASFLRNEKNIRNIFYEPLYAAYTVVGEYQDMIPMEPDEGVRITLDGEVLRDSFTVNADTLYIRVEMEPGLHYMVIEKFDTYGSTKSIKTIDLYSL